MEEEVQEGKDRSPNTYGVALYKVTSFKYMGQVLAAEDENLPSVVRIPRHVKQKWARLTRILIREGENAHTSVHIYLAVVQ